MTIFPTKLQQEEIQTRTLASDVRERLRADIVSGMLKPGLRLRFEELRARYDVGLSPLREALFRLVSEGLVISEDHRGFRVAPVSRMKLMDISFMRKELESMALKLSIERGDIAWESAVLASFHQLSSISTNNNNGSLDLEWGRRHKAFHFTLASACGSDWLLQFRETLADQWARYSNLCIQFTRYERDVLAEHREIMEAALARDAPAGVYLIGRHISRSTQIVLDSDATLFALDDPN
ncbi:FCD domain-containing protein [Bosea sp. (in: a-proteobacteria)]|uniref:FCD domain-containing protein n=1 Tax=Bosea sp. (in: a-proteobacteria) TaxID=1871050 RepID=UPI002625E17A|nr:FCD domain-containing protein [Bosea sp. (in: a-proteobacteria)]MCO5089459.1 FCD domain-containing protein [Bosea sp. (in: a-proteobacteria)]